MRRFVHSLALASIVLAGCAPGKGDVSGKVTYNGAPLAKPGGTIVFVTPGGVQVAAPVAADGTYRAPDVPRGENKVAVYYPNPKFQELAKQSRHLPGPNEAVKPAPIADVPPYLTPAKYASGDTSGLSVSVGTGTAFDAALTGPPIK
ncbi:hypothetical protein [Gemmata sp.]|uniref:hypothetical protein n=1 Tax=Gemmata sp. TaxID=1914242 RepID=UPI003F71F31F